MTSEYTDMIGQSWVKLFGYAKRRSEIDDGEDADRLSLWISVVLLPRIQDREERVRQLKEDLRIARQQRDAEIQRVRDLDNELAELKAAADDE